MSTGSKYWTLVKLDATGRCKTEAIAKAKAFFYQQIPLAVGADVSDTLLQRRLLSIMHAESNSSDRSMAEQCLRCYISHLIQQVCLRLEFQFGSSHGFSRTDLFSFVLDDTGTSQLGSYQPLATKILQTFDLERGSLASWTMRLVKHHPELNKFLLERGVYMISNWAILNDTSTKQLARILGDYQCLTPAEIQLAVFLLESYHAVYQRDRIQQRQLGVTTRIKGPCPPPTAAQLQEIAQRVAQAKAAAGFRFVPLELRKNIFSQLQALAARLRQHRIYVRGGFPATASLDALTNQPNLDGFHSAGYISDGDHEDAQQDTQIGEFLQSYRQQFITCLDWAIEQAVQTRYTTLQRQAESKAEQFVQALTLFYNRRSMTDIAIAVGLKAQSQVSRLLQLKQLRTDVKSRLLEALRSYVIGQTRTYTEPERFQSLHHSIEVALDEQISLLVQQAEREASIPTKYPLQSLLAQRMCHYLDAIQGTEDVSSDGTLPVAA